MRFIHTADWHLGRLFHGVHLTDDQAYIVDQFVGLAKEARVAAVLIAATFTIVRFLHPKRFSSSTRSSLAWCSIIVCQSL